MKWSRRFLWLAAGSAAGALGAVYMRYQLEYTAARHRLNRGSQIYPTSCGPVEAALTGSGFPLLVLHGGGAGYDLGLLFTWPGFMTISPSRPGYLRTPLESGATFEAQADLCAALLQQLGVEQAAVIGMSGSGPVALQFALRHPNRCRALVLVSAIHQPLPPYPRLMQLVMKQGEHAGFLPWLIMQTPLLYRISYPKLEGVRTGPPERRKRFESMMACMFPFKGRMDGVLNDQEHIARLAPPPLELIRAPTLVIHGDADSIVPFSQGQAAAAYIPGAQFVPIHGADHLGLFTHGEQAEAAMVDFLRLHARARAD